MSSLSPDTPSCLFGERSTVCVDPCSVSMVTPSSACHIYSLWSLLAVRIRRLSGMTKILVTGLECSWNQHETQVFDTLDDEVIFSLFQDIGNINALRLSSFYSLQREQVAKLLIFFKQHSSLNYCFLYKYT